MGQRKPFRINRREKKILGVSAGIADHFEVDVTLVRVAMVLALILTFPLVGFAYLVLAFALPSDNGRVGRDTCDAQRLSSASVEATRQRMRELDQRMQLIETSVTSSNTALAREIDALR